MSSVSIVKCPEYEQSKQSMEKALDLLGGLKKYIKQGDKVLIKPNLVDPVPPEKGSDTHPLFLKSIIELVKEITPNVYVGECSGGNDKGITQRCYEVSGAKKVVEETGAEFINFQENRFIPKDIDRYKVLEKTDFAEALFDMDFIINLPKFKTHGVTFMTSGMKNYFGCVHPLERTYLHKEFPKTPEFSKGIVDVFSFINSLKPSLTILDAIRTMEGNEGPSHGDLRKTNLILASEDTVALDTVISKITGHNPKAIPMIKDAYERGLGESDLTKIDVLGEKIEDVEMKDFKQNALFTNRYRNMPGYGKFFEAEPVLDKEKCIKCGICARNCPVGAIKLDPYPVIDRKKCIKCFCCQELCPEHAMRVNLISK